MNTITKESLELLKGALAKPDGPRQVDLDRVRSARL
jgi:hypothetical protein